MNDAYRKHIEEMTEHILKERDDMSRDDLVNYLFNRNVFLADIDNVLDDLKEKGIVRFTRHETPVAFWDRFRVEEIERNICSVRHETYKDESGALRWFSSDNCVPTECLVDAGVDAETIRRTEEANGRDIDELREKMMDREYTDEEMFEMRAAFGPGTTVVNVLTGKKIKL